MIRFDCTGCGKKLSVPDETAGKLATCPGCKAKVRIPAGGAAAAPAAPAPAARPPGKPAGAVKGMPPLPPPAEVEPLDDDVPAPRAGKRPIRRQDDEDDFEDDEDRDPTDWEKGPWFNGNRIRGVVAVVFAAIVLVFSLTYEKFKNPGDFAFGEYGTPAGCVLAGLLFLAGVFYFVRG